MCDDATPTVIDPETWQSIKDFVQQAQAVIATQPPLEPVDPALEIPPTWESP